MEIKRRSNSLIEQLITNSDFYDKEPWFYNNPFALRCELGIGDSKRIYLKNAKKRAYEIFDILFPNSPDAIFFDHHIENLTADGKIHTKRIFKFLRKNILFLAEHINNYDSTIINDIPLDEEEKDFYVQKNRVVCYTDKKYPYQKRVIENFPWGLRTVHFVSFENECILSIYDDRGCDIVFATHDKMCEFYHKLEPYLLEHDLEEMKKRVDNG